MLLGYPDAVRLLGGKDSPVVSALDKLAGGVLLAGGALCVPGFLGLLDARSEVARLGHELVRGLTERRSGLSRYTRTQRLEAALAVLVVTAFFDALAEADLPLHFGEQDFTKADQARLAGVLRRSGNPLEDILLSDHLVPAAMAAGDGTAAAQVLRGRYAVVADQLEAFGSGLAVADRITETDLNRFNAILKHLPDRAVERYQELFRRLATDFPEVACWANLRGHAATQTQVRKLDTALSGLERRLAAISTGQAPDQRRAGLARAYRAALDRPVVESGDVPAGMELPTLGEAYLPPLFRAAEVGSQSYRGGRDRLSDESWWAGEPVRDDLAEFLTGYLTAPPATRAPLLVLGQPGSGKSVLTRVLAARLPAADFLPVRVPLRDVSATADPQDQIEQAIRAATGERIDWPALAGSARDALPVVLLDGFDELLQATGVSQSDYLTRVAGFQRREADQGRPVAVVVTTRISVADRARAPEDAVALRLEPFDAERVETWLDTWNRVNYPYFAATGLAPLGADTALTHRELAEQPLLLLMLALYDADGNPLLRSAEDLGRGSLYERLLRSFARREVTKHRPGLPDREVDRAVEEELRRLSAVAFAMFNRGSQWVAEADLDADLRALFGDPALPARTDLRAVLGPGETALGRFFFVHRAQATRDEGRLETYEFLHATFGEFLVARLTWQVLRDVAARDAAATLTLAAAPPADDLLHALCSFAPLSARAPVLGFLADAAARLEPAERAALADLVLRLFRVVHQARPGRGFAAYLPRALTVPARHAAYSANLVLLAVCAAAEVAAGDLFPAAADPATAWHDECLLWHSQLDDEGFTSLVEALRLDRRWDGERRNPRVGLDTGAGLPIPPVDPRWTYRRPPAGPGGPERMSHGVHGAEVLRRWAHVQGGDMAEVATHLWEPVAAALPETVNAFLDSAGGSCASAAHALLGAWLSPFAGLTVERRAEAYRWCLRIALTYHGAWDYPTSDRYCALLLDRLATDDTLPPEAAAEVLTDAATSMLKSRPLVPHVIRAALTHLGRERASDIPIAAALLTALTRPADGEHPILDLAAWARLAELGLALPHRGAVEERLRDPRDWDTVVRHRPDLPERLRRCGLLPDAAGRHGTRDPG